MILRVQLFSSSDNKCFDNYYFRKANYQKQVISLVKSANLMGL